MSDDDMSRIGRRLAIIEHILEQQSETLERFFAYYKHINPLPGTSALTLTIGGDMALILGTDGTATVQFVDGAGNPGPGPTDPTTGSPVVPVVASDNDAVLTVVAGVAGTKEGEFTYVLAPVTAGTANVSVADPVDSNGSPALDSAGNPYALPAPVAETVTGAPTTAMTLTVS